MRITMSQNLSFDHILSQLNQIHFYALSKNVTSCSKFVKYVIPIQFPWKYNFLSYNIQFLCFQPRYLSVNIVYLDFLKVIRIDYPCFYTAILMYLMLVHQQWTSRHGCHQCHLRLRSFCGTRLLNVHRILLRYCRSYIYSFLGGGGRGAEGGGGVFENVLIMQRNLDLLGLQTFRDITEIKKEYREM